ncbi:phage holin [Paenibacillus sepulcri]|uniref:Phage holin n=1 Tax=Paenibacillus sepulcri TaxID=359917 RepID=A0ABS7C161_9BACL|nr:phage holin [Paenibacillus sepulcri]
MEPYLIMIVQALVGLLAAFLLGCIAKLHKKVSIWLDIHTTSGQRDMLDKLAKEAAALAEATYIESGGPQKLEAAFAYVANHITRLGIEVSAETIRAAIEKAVLDFKKPPTPESR